MKVVPTGTNQTPSHFKRVAAVCPVYGGLTLLGKRVTHCAVTGEPVGYGGYWSPFGGTLEGTEGPLVGAVRELKEETEIEVSLDSLIYIREIPITGGVYILYACELRTKLTPRINFEHVDWGYFSLESLHKNPTPICPHVQSALQDWDKHRRFKV